MKDFKKYFDIGSILVIFVTLVLFVAALFYTGFTHDLLLEAGVFLVSVKLILMSYKNAVSSLELKAELAAIRSLLESLQKSR